MYPMTSSTPFSFFPPPPPPLRICISNSVFSGLRSDVSSIYIFTTLYFVYTQVNQRENLVSYLPGGLLLGEGSNQLGRGGGGEGCSLIHLANLMDENVRGITRQSDRRRCPPTNQGWRCLPAHQGRRCLPANQGRRCLPANQGRRSLPVNQGRTCLPANQGRRCLQIIRDEDVY